MQERRDGYNLEQRNASENAFFMRDQWNNIGHSRAGITALGEFLGDMVYSMLQEDIDLLLLKIQGLTEPTSAVRFASSIDSIRPVFESRHSIVRSYPVSEHVSDVDETSTCNDEDSDLEVGSIKKRPTILISAFSVGLTLMLVMALIGLGCEQLAQEIATDGSWLRLLLLITAPLQVFVSLVSFS